MKISASMYGQPGKCVACRQKIRIPREDELEPGQTELYLKDHPEFLRKAKSRKSGAKTPESHDASPRQQRKRSVTLPLDVYPPLNAITNILVNLSERVSFLEKEDPSAYEGELNELKQQARRARRARVKLDEKLRARLMEVAMELADVQKEIADICLAARVGEMELAAFLGRIEERRRRRDYLERCQQDLRGWLAIQNVHYTGGRISMSADAKPEVPDHVSLPDPPDPSVSLLEMHIDALTEAMSRRQDAEQRMDEALRIGPGDLPPGTSIEHMRGETKAARRLADVTVKFHRARLEQLQNDFLEDLKVCDAQMDRLRDRFHAGEVDRVQRDQQEQTMLRAKHDLNKARDLLTRVLSANSSRDVPAPRQTLLKRFAGRRGAPAPLTADIWIAWAAALGLAVSVFLPFGRMTPLGIAGHFAGQGPGPYLPIAIPFVLAALASSVALLPNLRLRGILFGMIWTASLLGAISLFHEARYGTTSFDAYLREYAAVWSSPAEMMAFLALMAIGVSAIIALWNDPPIRPTLAVFPILLGIGASVVLTDAWGLLRPRIVLDAISIERPDAGSQEATCRVPVRNVGRRTVSLAVFAQEPSAFQLVLDRQGELEWERLSDAPFEIDSGVGTLISDAPHKTRVALPPGERVTFRFRLSEGLYKATILSNLSGPKQWKSFNVEMPAVSAFVPRPIVPPPPRAAIGSAAETDVDRPGEVEPSQAPPKPTVTKVRVGLHGVIAAENRPPQFSFTLYLPSGVNEDRVLDIGGKIYGSWTVGEYNRTEQTVTITNGVRMAVVRQGEIIAID